MSPCVLCPPAFYTVRIIEGTEDIGYRANSPEAYNGAFTRLKLRLPEFAAPEHRVKVERQFRSRSGRSC